MTEMSALRKHKAPCLYVCVEVPRYRIVFRISKDDFVDSPNSYNYYHHILNIYMEPFHRVKREQSKVLIRELVEYYVDQFYLAFSPPPPWNDGDRLTLADIQVHAVLNCFFSYNDEQPVFNGFSYEHLDDPLELPLTWAMRSPFPSFYLHEVEIPPDEPGFDENRKECFNDFSPVRVTVDGTSYFYQPILLEKDDFQFDVSRTIEDMEDEIAQHFEIAFAGISYDELGILPLKGIVIDDKAHVYGLLKEWTGIRQENFLDVMLRDFEEEEVDYWVDRCRDMVQKIFQTGLKLGPFDARDMAFDDKGRIVLVHLVKGEMGDGEDYYSVHSLGEVELLRPFIEVVAEAESQRAIQGMDECNCCPPQLLDSAECMEVEDM